MRDSENRRDKQDRSLGRRCDDIVRLIDDALREAVGPATALIPARVRAR